MATMRNGGPYIWTTWLTKLLVGEDSCEWASWFKGQHQSGSWAKKQNGFDQVNWLLAHTQAINACRQAGEAKGYKVYTEAQNAFTLRGKSATLGGKPDLIVRKGEKGTIIDVKTGKPNPSHAAQVMIYQYAIPKSLVLHHGVRFDGLVVYPDHEVEVPADAVDADFVSQMAGLIGRLASETPARKVPSLQECGYCDITRTDCPDRMSDEPRVGGVTQDF